MIIPPAVANCQDFFHVITYLGVGAPKIAVFMLIKGFCDGRINPPQKP